MKTAEDAISFIQELPQGERQKVKAFLQTEDAFLEEDYSPEDIEKILQTAKEAEQGINVSPVLKTTEESIAYLRQFRKA